jgi:hypothetical protein
MKGGLFSWGIELLKKLGLYAERAEDKSENLDLNPGFSASDSSNEEGKSPLPSPIRKDLSDQATDSEHIDSLSINLKRKLENITNKEGIVEESDDPKKRKELDNNSNE